MVLERTISHSHFERFFVCLWLCENKVKTMKIAFNTTNINQGGALQVAVSFIDDFCNDPEMNGCVAGCREKTVS